MELCKSNHIKYFVYGQPRASQKFFKIDCMNLDYDKQNEIIWRVIHFVWIIFFKAWDFLEQINLSSKINNINVSLMFATDL